MKNPILRLHQHRHGPFFIGAILAAVALIASAIFVPGYAPGIGADVFFVVYLLLIGARIPHLDAERLRRTGQDDDEPAAVILIVTLLAAIISIGLLFEALNSGKNASVFEVVLAFSSVLLGWLTIHTMFAIHYAHLFWRPSQQAEKDEGKRGGLSFPETHTPGAYDFLYFSFVIGMTAQTSDVEITTTGMRRINLAHSIVSFFFNTVLVAASVNAAVSLGT